VKGSGVLSGKTQSVGDRLGQMRGAAYLCIAAAGCSELVLFLTPSSLRLRRRAQAIRCSRGLCVTLVGSEPTPFLVWQSVGIDTDIVWHGIGAKSHCRYVNPAH